MLFDNRRENFSLPPRRRSVEVGGHRAKRREKRIPLSPRAMPRKPPPSLQAFRVEHPVAGVLETPTTACHNGSRFAGRLFATVGLDARPVTPALARWAAPGPANEAGRGSNPIGRRKSCWASQCRCWTADRLRRRFPIPATRRTVSSTRSYLSLARCSGGGGGDSRAERRRVVVQKRR